MVMPDYSWPRSLFGSCRILSTAITWFPQDLLNMFLVRNESPAHLSLAQCLRSQPGEQVRHNGNQRAVHAGDGARLGALSRVCCSTPHLWPDKDAVERFQLA